MPYLHVTSHPGYIPAPSFYCVQWEMQSTLTCCNFHIVPLCFNTAKACEKFELCKGECWKPDGDRVNIAWGTERESQLLGWQKSLRYMWQGCRCSPTGDPYAQYCDYTHCLAFTTILVHSKVIHTCWQPLGLVVGMYVWATVEPDR